MKRMRQLLSITLLAVLVGCGGGNKLSNDGLITVDVTKSYPQKELILQDFMDVEYIPLETTDDFLCQGLVLSVGKKYLIARNRTQDGNIFIYDRNGKAVKKINRKGQGDQEYAMILRIVLDEDKNELFVNSASDKIMVYDLDGNFKRALKNESGSTHYIYNFNETSLICGSVFNNNSHAIISKQDGRIVQKIDIPHGEPKLIYLSQRDDKTNTTYSVTPSGIYPIIPYFDSWILTELSADTVYRYSSDYTMTPIIARTPSIQAMTPEVFLFPNTFTKRYYFIDAIEKTYDFAIDDGFPTKYLVYDNVEKAVYQQSVYNNDFSIPRKVIMNMPPINGEIANYQILQSYELVRLNENGKIKGKLKEIASKLDEDSNPVIMLVKHKNQ